jgi:Mg2+ and Co2+ transporter CorA
MNFLFKAILGELYEEIFSIKKNTKQPTNSSKELEEIVKSELKDIRDAVETIGEEVRILNERIDCIDDIILEDDSSDALKRVVEVHKIVSENRSMINELYTIQEMMAKLALPQQSLPSTQKKQQDPYSLPSIKKNDDKDKLN